MAEPETITIRVPAWVKGDEIIEDVEKLLEEKYGIVSQTLLEASGKS
jgi:hypothetical protein